MIDFRYHLVSIIAVFLALAIGMVLGSAVFGSPLLKNLRGHVKSVRETNDDLKNQISDLHAVVAANRSFAEEVEPWLVAGALKDTPVVVVEPAGTNSSVVSALQDEVATAGGTVTGTISLTDKFALASAPDREELGLILGIAPRKVPMLRARAGAELGQRMGVAANPPARGGIADEITPGSKNKQLLGDLQRAGFVSLGSGTGPEAVPAGAVFLVVVGDAGAPPFNATNLLIPFVRHLAGVGAVVTVASPSASSWKVVDEIRSESRTAAEVSTVDDAETIPGHISSVLTLDRSADDPADHYGTGPGATSVIPSPPPSQNR